MHVQNKYKYKVLFFLGAFMSASITFILVWFFLEYFGHLLSDSVYLKNIIDLTFMFISEFKAILIILSIVILIKLFLNSDRIIFLSFSFIIFSLLLLTLNIQEFDCTLNSANKTSYSFYSTQISICYTAPFDPNSSSNSKIFAFSKTKTSTFQSINSNYAKDSRNVYFAELETKCDQCHSGVKKVGILEGADPETFHIDEDGIPRDKNQTFKRLPGPWEYIPYITD